MKLRIFDKSFAVKLVANCQHGLPTIVLFSSLLAHAGIDRVVPIGDIEGQASDMYDRLIDNEAVELDSSGRLNVIDGTKISFTGDIYDRGPYSMRSLKTINDMARRQPDQVDKVAGNRDPNKLRLLFELFDNVNDPARSGGPYYQIALKNGVGYNRLAGLNGTALEQELAYQKKVNDQIDIWLEKKFETLQSHPAETEKSITNRFLRTLQRDVAQRPDSFKILKSDPVVRLTYLLETQMGAGKAFDFRAQEMAAIRAGIVSVKDIELFENERRDESAQLTQWREAKKSEIARHLSEIDPGEVLMSMLHDMITDVRVEKKVGDTRTLLRERPELAPYKEILAKYLLEGDSQIISIERETRAMMIHGDIKDEAVSAIEEGWLPKFTDVNRALLHGHLGVMARQSGIPEPKVNDVFTTTPTEFRRQYLKTGKEVYGQIDPQVRDLTGLEKGRRYVKVMNSRFREAVRLALQGVDPADGLSAWYDHTKNPLMQVLSLSVARSTESDGMPAPIQKRISRFVESVFGAVVLFVGHTPTSVPCIAVTEGLQPSQTDGLVKILTDQSFSNQRQIIEVRRGGWFRVEYRTNRASSSDRFWPISWRITRSSKRLNLVGQRVKAVHSNGAEFDAVVAAIHERHNDGDALIFRVDTANGFANEVFMADLQTTASAIEGQTTGTCISTDRLGISIVAEIKISIRWRRAL